MGNNITKTIFERIDSISGAIQISLQDLYLAGYRDGYRDALKLPAVESEKEVESAT